jgi:hypothetical protein
MATHAIAGEQQRGIVGGLSADTVLIAIACAPEAEYSVFDAQAGSISLG